MRVWNLRPSIVAPQRLVTTPLLEASPVQSVKAAGEHHPHGGVAESRGALGPGVIGIAKHGRMVTDAAIVGSTFKPCSTEMSVLQNNW